MLSEINEGNYKLPDTKSESKKDINQEKNSKNETTNIDPSFNPNILKKENVVRSISKDEKIYKDPDTGVNYRVKRNSTMDVIGAEKV